MYRSTGDSTLGRTPIRFGTYNICNDQNGGLEIALQGMSQVNMDLGIYQETNLTFRFYTRGSSVYSVIAMNAPIQHQSGVEVFFRLLPRYAVEDIQKFGRNIFGFQITTIQRRWYIIRCYLAPNNISTIKSVVTALKKRPWRLELLVVGGLNANLDHTEVDWREGKITAALTTAVLEDMLAHFLPERRPWCWEGRTWSMVRLGREVRSWTDYILGTDCCLVRNVAAWDPRNNLEHYMVIGCLRSSPLR